MESVQREERIVMENVVPLEVIHTPVLIMMMTIIGIMALGAFDSNNYFTFKLFSFQHLILS